MVRVTTKTKKSYIQCSCIQLLTYHDGASATRGDCGGRGEAGSPIIVEYRFPREDCVTETFKPFDVAIDEALVVAFAAFSAIMIC